jgi:hypothetical protein
VAINLKNQWIAVSNENREFTVGDGGEVQRGVVLGIGESVSLVDIGDTLIYETSSLITFMDGENSSTLIHESSIILTVT